MIFSRSLSLPKGPRKTPLIRVPFLRPLTQSKGPRPRQSGGPLPAPEPVEGHTRNPRNPAPFHRSLTLSKGPRNTPPIRPTSPGP
ncbi:hypothetical protein PLANTIT3_50329 [Plantibacter sp. T3]|nr:hypothetical protein PLANTIT3_50329 [Plantibacter sp. T3]